MSAAVPRLRMFAGPNGSGKSTIKEILPLQWLGVYVNADEMEKSSRYVRSLELLSQAVMHADRAYIFDNSDSDRLWVAEVTEGVEIEMKSDEMPAWFKKALWDKFE